MYFRLLKHLKSVGKEHSIGSYSDVWKPDVAQQWNSAEDG